MSTAAEARVATAYARVREHLAYLGLTTASEQLAAELERAKTEQAAPVEVLERLLAAETVATAARKLSGRLRFAHYPLDKRLEKLKYLTLQQTARILQQVREISEATKPLGFREYDVTNELRDCVDLHKMK